MDREWSKSFDVLRDSKNRHTTIGYCECGNATGEAPWSTGGGLELAGDVGRMGNDSRTAVLALA